jgi:lipopolysaccharide export system protein LptA
MAVKFPKKIAFLFTCAILFSPYIACGEDGVVKEPIPQAITVNGDIVEYLSDSKEISATGNVAVIYKGAKLTCNKLVVNTQTKEGLAEGGARLEDEKGIIEGEKIKYNFQAKTGTILEPSFRVNPYFGKAEKLEKISDAELVAKRGYISTCSLDKPHYRFKSRRINIFPGDKVQTRDTTVYIRGIPLAYLPQYNHSLKDPIMHVQVMPGKRKDWGAYLLTAWRYKLTNNISGRIYFDLRSKLGVAEGFGANYKSEDFGKGDFKYYYSHEEPSNLPQNTPANFQRYLIRWRHQWDIDERTNLVSEYYKITDSKRSILGTQYNMLKDYFFREYEKDSQPLSYTQLHHSFQYSSVDVLVQKRINRWYEQLEKLPEIKYSLPNLKIGESPVYFENSFSAASFNYKYAVPSESANDISMNRFDTTNKFSLPMRVSFIQLTPFVMNRLTYYDKGADGASVAPRTIFYSGADASTKFYRIFDVKSNFLKMDINGLRHIITPSVAYSYNHKPSVASNKLLQIPGNNGIESISRSNAATLELSNKLQTKRDNKTVDLVDFRMNSAYTFKTRAGRGGNLGDLLFDLTLLPYSWTRLDADATYSHYNDYFSSANYDLSFGFFEGCSISIGQRYQRKSSNELTTSFNWRLSPKWRLSAYERFFVTDSLTTKTGLREQEYTISRDLHCWDMGLTYNVRRGEGESIWLVFTLKAFPEMEINFNQSYHAPKSGAAQ